jgi:hypothetical protein
MESDHGGTANESQKHMLVSATMLSTLVMASSSHVVAVVGRNEPWTTLKTEAEAEAPPILSH